MSYITISATVGQGGTNHSSDVLAIQVMLNHFIRNHWLPGYKKLGDDGDWGTKTKKALRGFMGLYAPDEFTWGFAAPHGSTIKTMNKNAGFLGPVAKPSSTGPVAKPSSTGNIDVDIDALIRDWGKKVKLTAGDKSYIQKVLEGSPGNLGFSDTSSIIALVENAVDIMAAVRGTTEGISQISSFSAILGFIGPFAQFLGFVKDISKIYGQRASFYGAIASAYWMTSWAYKDERPAKSQKYLDKVRAKSNDKPFHNAWKNGMEAGSKGVEHLVAKVRNKTNLSNSDARAALRFLMCRKSKEELARDILKSMKTSFLSKPPAFVNTVIKYYPLNALSRSLGGWTIPEVPPSISPGVAMFFEIGVSNVSYPK